MKTPIDFDKIDEWRGDFRESISPHLPADIENILRLAKPEFIQDARDILYDASGRDQIIDATLNWIAHNEVIAYHGSRLTGAEIESVKLNGLRPLSIGDREGRVQRSLIRHPRWPEIFDTLADQIRKFGSEDKIGRREGQVHFTLSRSGLLKGFNHYLKYGAEFDQRVVVGILGKEGLDWLERDGEACLVRARIRGDAAIAAAHPYFSVEDLRARGDTPNLIDSFLCAWSYQIAYPEFDPSILKLDSGMVFFKAIPILDISRM